MKFISISITRQINRTVVISLLKIRENAWMTRAYSQSDGLVCFHPKASIIIFWRQWWECCYHERRALHRDNQQLFCAWMTTKTFVVSAGWSDGSHSQRVNERSSPSFRWPPHFQLWWHSLALLVSGFVHL